MKEKNVTFQIFAWAMGINLIVFGWIFTQMTSLGTKIELGSAAQSEIKVQLSQIQADLIWIRQALQKP